MAQLKEFIRNYGYHLSGADNGISPLQIRTLLTQLKGKPEEVMISTMTLRSMQRASYTTECGGHFGLALRYYCHFTSPIRRYPDLQIHRIIKEYLHTGLTDSRRQHYEEILPGVCRQSSQRERLADEAERETDKQKKAEYMKERIGEEFDGVVSGVTSWGLFVALPNTVEGLIPIGEIRDDYYDFDENRYMLVGEHTGRTFALGQPLKVVCAAADTVNRTVDFVLAKDAYNRKMDPVRVAGQRQNAEDRFDTRFREKPSADLADNGKPRKLRRDGRPLERHKRSRRGHHGRHRS